MWHDRVAIIRTFNSCWMIYSRLVLFPPLFQPTKRVFLNPDRTRLHLILRISCKVTNGRRDNATVTVIVEETGMPQ